MFSFNPMSALAAFFNVASALIKVAVSVQPDPDHACLATSSLTHLIVSPTGSGSAAASTAAGRA